MLNEEQLDLQSGLWELFQWPYYKWSYIDAFWYNTIQCTLTDHFIQLFQCDNCTFVFISFY